MDFTLVHEMSHVHVVSPHTSDASRLTLNTTPERKPDQRLAHSPRSADIDLSRLLLATGNLRFRPLQQVAELARLGPQLAQLAQRARIARIARSVRRRRPRRRWWRCRGRRRGEQTAAVAKVGGVGLRLCGGCRAAPEPRAHRRSGRRVLLPRLVDLRDLPRREAARRGDRREERACREAPASPCSMTGGKAERRVASGASLLGRQQKEAQQHIAQILKVGPAAPLVPRAERSEVGCTRRAPRSSSCGRALCDPGAQRTRELLVRGVRGLELRNGLPRPLERRLQLSGAAREAGGHVAVGAAATKQVLGRMGIGGWVGGPAKQRKREARTCRMTFPSASSLVATRAAPARRCSSSVRLHAGAQRGHPFWCGVARRPPRLMANACRKRALSSSLVPTPMVAVWTCSRGVEAPLPAMPRRAASSSASFCASICAARALVSCVARCTDSPWARSRHSSSLIERVRQVLTAACRAAHSASRRRVSASAFASASARTSSVALRSRAAACDSARLTALLTAVDTAAAERSRSSLRTSATASSTRAAIVASAAAASVAAAGEAAAGEGVAGEGAAGESAEELGGSAGAAPIPTATPRGDATTSSTEACVCRRSSWSSETVCRSEATS